jgi:hypothetical protein
MMRTRHRTRGPAMSVHVKVFSSNARAMGDICSDAAEFASTLTPETLISISQTKEEAKIWVVVWYWA